MEKFLKQLLQFLMQLGNSGSRLGPIMALFNLHVGSLGKYADIVTAPRRYIGLI